VRQLTFTNSALGKLRQGEHKPWNSLSILGRAYLKYGIKPKKTKLFRTGHIK
jgi:hypothetical protein